MRPRTRVSRAQHAAAATREVRFPGALWVALALLAGAHATVALLPSMWAWGMNVQRFQSPLLGWSLWALTVAALFPQLARPLAPWLDRAGRALERSPGWTTLVATLGAAVMVLAMGDRVQFVGDFLLRQGTLRERLGDAAWYPQAMPLDMLIHGALARAAGPFFSLDANGVGRAIGVLEAALFAALAVRAARSFRLHGAGAMVAVAVFFWGGYLTLFTGYNKAFSEMCLIAAAAGLFALESLHDRRGLLPLGITLGLGLLLHRSAVGLLPLGLVVGIVWVRRHPWRDVARDPRVWVAALVPLVVLALLAGKIAHVVTHIDPMHFAPEAAGQGPWAAAFTPLRVVDQMNLIVMLAPLAVLLPVLALGAARMGRDEILVLAALTVPFLGVMPWIHPGQGYFRDWDDFAATGVVLSLVAARLSGSWVDGLRQHRWIGVAVMLAAVIPSLQWLLHHTDFERGLARVQAFQAEPPRRPRAERYTTWQYLGVRYAAERRFTEAADSYAHGAEETSSPHILHQWAAAEMESGDLAAAREVYGRLVARDPHDRFAWLMLAQASLGLSDEAGARRAAFGLLRMDPESAEARQILAIVGADSSREEHHADAE